MTQIAEGMNAVPRHTAGQRMATVGHAKLVEAKLIDGGDR